MNYYQKLRTGSAWQLAPQDFGDGPSGVTRLALAILATCVCVLVCTCPPAAAAEAPHVPIEVSAVDLKPAANVDERLLLMRVLEAMYQRLPAADEEAGKLASELGGLRHEARRYTEHIKDRQLDTKLASLFEDYVGALDAYATFLASTDKIQQDAVEKAQANAGKSGFKGGFDGTSVGLQAKDSGYTNGESLGIGLLVAAISGLSDYAQRDRELEQAKRQALAEAAKIVRDRFDVCLARCQNAASDLTTKYGWAKGEAGFQDRSLETEKLAELRRAGDEAAVGDYMLKTTRLHSSERPRDPFACVAYARMTAFVLQASQAKPEELAAVAEDCLRAVRMVPQGSLYDDIRAAILTMSADICNAAFVSEIQAAGFAGARSRIAQRAVVLWDARLAYGEDPTGHLRAGRAWALAASGRLQDGIRQANEVVKLCGNEADFAYNYACLLSVAGHIDKAMEWLDYTVRKLKYTSIRHIKTDPDFAALRREKAKELADLLTVRWSWIVDYGVFNDDVVVTNESPFALTNVKLEARLVQDGKVWNLDLKVPSIPAGEKHTWSNAVSIPGSRLSEGKATLACEEQ